MRAGQTCYKDGYQVALFPMDILNCTQVSGPSSYSHCCGHPCDWVGTYSPYPIYAPFDCHLTSQLSSGNARVYTSDHPVLTPSGVTYVTFNITHDNNPPSQTSFRQGELIGHTGTAGQVTGAHAHIDQALMADSRIVSYGITCQMGNLCYALQQSSYVFDTFFITNDDTIINLMGMPFTLIEDYHGGTMNPSLIATLFINNKKRRTKHARLII